MDSKQNIQQLKINKENFFKVREVIIDSKLFEEDKKNKTKKFDLEPLSNITNRFEHYLTYLENFGISLNINKKLLVLLKKIETDSATINTVEHDKFLLRILGIICKTTFVGPEYFHLDISNPCNIDCNYCWFYSKHLSNPPSYEFKKAMIKFNDFKHVVDDLSSLLTDTILFTGAGEPFLHPKINEMIEYVKSKNVKLQIFTNGTLINKKCTKTIIKSKTDELFISVSASNPKTYTIVHPNQKDNLFYDCEANIKRLIKQKTKHSQKKPNIVLLFVLCKDNYKDIIEMADWTDKLGADSIRYQIAHNKDSKNIELNNSEKKYVREKIEYVIKKYENKRLHINPNILFQLKNTKKNNEWYDGHYIKKGCYVGWFFSRLWADGIYSFCCIKKEIEHLKQKNSFNSLWKSKKYHNYRQAAASGGKSNIKLSKTYSLIDSDCSVCGNYEINEKVYNYLKNKELLQYL